MSIKLIVPNDVHAPAGAYSHGAVTQGPGRTLYVSGQLGVDPAGALADGFTGQATRCWQNIVATLGAAGMTVRDLVKVTTFLTDTRNAAEFGRIRELFLQGARPASTLIGISELVRPEWLIEIEAIAFKAD